MGLANDPHYDRYHSFLSKSVFNELRLVRIILGLLLSLLPSGSPILIAMDETIERRKGAKITAKGCYRDACRSTRTLVIHCFGLKWQCAAILIKLPWSKRYWALPFMTVLCKPNKCTDLEFGYKVINMESIKHILGGNIGYYKGQMYYCNSKNVNTPFPDDLNQKLVKDTADKSLNKILKIIKRNIDKLAKKNTALFTELSGQRKIRHKTSIDCAAIMMKKISHILKRNWVMLGDGGFSCIKLALACSESNVTLISRFRLNAALYNPVITTDVKKGRKPLKGIKAPLLRDLVKADKDWEDHDVSWYGNTIKKLQLLTGTNLWYVPGHKPILIRYVVVRDPVTNNVQSFFSTDINLSAVKIVEYFILRWNIETTFEEVRAHLGVETQRQWSDKAINRTTPILMGIFSLVCIIAYKMSYDSISNISIVPIISTAWYKKNNQATFSDIILYVKQAILGASCAKDINTAQSITITDDKVVKNIDNNAHNADSELNIVNNTDNLSKKLTDCINSCISNSIINNDYVQIPRKYFDKMINLRC
jgi:hypothetical protein